jgi:hypothetical protein
MTSTTRTDQASHPREPSEAASHAGSAMGGPLTLLRLEGLVVLAAASCAYQEVGAGWSLFALLFLVPDLSMLGYLVNRRVGAACYNAGHSYLGPALLLALGAAFHTPSALAVACVWVAHVGFDRLLGYGLKYASGFGDTHLGRKGRSAAHATRRPAQHHVSSERAGVAS